MQRNYEMSGDMQTISEMGENNRASEGLDSRLYEVLS
jgi:hypothetical protein